MAFFIDNFALRKEQNSYQTNNLEFSSFFVSSLDESVQFIPEHFPPVIKLMLDENSEAVPIYRGGKKISWKASDDIHEMTLTERHFQGDTAEFKEIQIIADQNSISNIKEEIDGSAQWTFHPGAQTYFALLSNSDGTYLNILHPVFNYSISLQNELWKSEFFFNFISSSCKFGNRISEETPSFMLPGNINFFPSNTDHGTSLENGFLNFPIQSKTKFLLDDQNGIKNCFEIIDDEEPYKNTKFPLECYSSSNLEVNVPFQFQPNTWNPFILNDVQILNFNSSVLDFSSFSSVVPYSRTFYVNWLFDPRITASYNIFSFPLATIDVINVSSFLSFQTETLDTKINVNCNISSIIAFEREEEFESEQKLVTFFVNISLFSTTNQIQLVVIDETSSDNIF